MIDEKLIEAAKYVKDNDSTMDADCHHDVCDPTFQESAKLLAQSIFDAAEREKDDEKEVTEEWLKSVGFEEEFTERPWRDSRSYQSSGSRKNGFILFIVCCYRATGITWHLNDGNGLMWLPNFEYRGDVRNLASALGIPLKEEGKTS